MESLSVYNRSDQVVLACSHPRSTPFIAHQWQNMCIFQLNSWLFYQKLTAPWLELWAPCFCSLDPTWTSIRSCQEQPTPRCIRFVSHSSGQESALAQHILACHRAPVILGCWLRRLKLFDQMSASKWSLCRFEHWWCSFELTIYGLVHTNWSVIGTIGYWIQAGLCHLYRRQILAHFDQGRLNDWI